MLTAPGIPANVIARTNRSCQASNWLLPETLGSDDTEPSGCDDTGKRGQLFQLTEGAIGESENGSFNSFQ